MPDPAQERLELPTREGQTWEDFETTDYRGDQYPAPRDWSVTATTTRAVLWERTATPTETGQEASSKDRAVLVTRRPNEPGKGLGEWCSFDLNGDPILCLEHEQPDVIWNAVCAILIRFTEGKPLFEPEALEEDRTPFTHAADITQGDLRGEFDA